MEDEIRWNEEGGKPADMVKNVSKQIGEGGGALLIGGPSFLVTPQQLGGKKNYIRWQGRVAMPCPVCKQGQSVHVYELQDDDLCCSCCELCGQYGWFKKPAKKEVG